jgi:hypothetical protein
VRPPLFDKDTLLEPKRNIDLLIVTGKEEGARHRADNVIGFSSQRNGAPDNMRVARKLRLPKIVAKDGDATLALEGFFIREGSPEERSDAQYIEKIAGDSETLQPLRLALSCEEHLAGAVGGDTGEHGVHLLPVGKVRRRGYGVGPVLQRVGFRNFHQPVRMRVGKRPP